LAILRIDFSGGVVPPDFCRKQKNPPAPAFLRVMVQGDYHFTLTLR
jgi:hypothetical protein